MKIPECDHYLPRNKICIASLKEEQYVELCEICQGVLYLNMYQNAMNRRYRMIFTRAMEVKP